jgi:hypothetical protein
MVLRFKTYIWKDVNDETLTVGGVSISDNCCKSTSKNKSLVLDNVKKIANI